ncbi:MAG: LuxR C-terminal-related transcriptional regulator [Gemmatimonadaceae bacterium]
MPRQSTTLDRGRAAFARKAWGEAYTLLSGADQEGTFEPGDVAALAMTCHLIGRDSEGFKLLERAHHEFLQRDDHEQAAISAFWLGFQLFMGGERAKGNGWLARARRVIDDRQLDSPTRGYLHMPVGIDCMQKGDAVGALAAFTEALQVGTQFADRELQTLARQGQGRALVRLGRIAEGVALLDEIMIAATAGDVSPPSVGALYCSVLEACHEIFDLRRAKEWTAALTEWCASQPDLVPFRGHCLVRRAEMMHLHGQWSDALDAAASACEWLSNPPQPAAGEAFYQRAEICRLRGDLDAAATAYRAASETGRSPHPGLALVRLAQGQLELAVAAIRRALDEAREQRIRCRVLGGYIEIMLAANDLDAARAGVHELSEIAERVDAPFLYAVAAHWGGALLFAEGDPERAIDALRTAGAIWRELEAPYESARVRVLLAAAQRSLGDEDGAQMDLDLARRIFEELGARPDVDRVAAMQTIHDVPRTEQLTEREIEVLRLVATGKTNRSIAQLLSISEKTVARHVSNIFTKLGLSSRAAATAYAFQHELVS